MAQIINCQLEKEKIIIMDENLILNRSFDFAVQTVEVYKYLCNKREFVLSKQLLRSGTSIGANVKEAMHGQSRKDFLSKMNIALKEANETEYWIELLIETGYLTKEDSLKYLNNCKELCRILGSIVKTTKSTI
jgi:four helix bundle protein